MFDAPAEAYDRYVGRYGRELARALIATAGVRDGMRALDVGCGPGALATELAALLGAESVVAADPSQSFASACAERLPGVRVSVASAEALPFPDGSFDAVLAQLVVNFMTDAPAGVREMRRVTRPGGTVAAAVWDYAGEMTLLRAFWDTAAALDPAAAAFDEGRSMGYTRPRRLERLWSGAGLHAVRVSPVVVSAEYSSFDDLWDPLLAGIGPAGAYAVSLPAAGRESLRNGLRARLGVGSEQPFTLSARAWVVVGAVP